MTTSTDDTPRPTSAFGENIADMPAGRTGATDYAIPGTRPTVLERFGGALTRMVRSRRPGQPDETEGALPRSALKSAGAVSLPSRRVVLAILMSAGGVRSRPKLPRVAGATAGGDADLLALATRSEALSARFRRAVAILVAVDSEVDKLVPPRPKPPVRGDVQGPAGFVGADEMLSDGQEAHGILSSAVQAARIEHQADVANWEAASLAIARRCGRGAALRKYGRTNRHLVSAAVALAGVQALSREGTLAKARACVEMFDACGTCDPPEWLSALARSTLRDVVATGREP